MKFRAAGCPAPAAVEANGMDDATKRLLFDKNRRIIDMVIERARRDFPDDIAIIGLTGSFATGDFHEKSDLDLIVVNNTKRGWKIGACFILDDVGYDIYCTPWETRIEDQANLDSPMISCLIDLEILYCAKPEYREKLAAYRNRALEMLAKPLGKECLERAKKCIDAAKQNYVDSLLSQDFNSVRHSAAMVLYNLTNALVNLNNTYFKRGVKRYLEEIAAFQHRPADFFHKYMAVIDAGTIDDARGAAFQFLRCMVDFHGAMNGSFSGKPVPTQGNLAGTYEEFWCNYRNKILVSTARNDKSYAFHVALGAQNFLNEMTETKGTKRLELMRYFDAGDLGSFKDGFLHVMDEYLEEYRAVGRKVEKYDTFEQLYRSFMKSGEPA
jgi:hypothetical protein